MAPDPWDFDNQQAATDKGDALFGHSPTGPPSQSRSWSGDRTVPIALPEPPPVTAQQPVYPPPVNPAPMATTPSRFGYALPVTGPPSVDRISGPEPKNVSKQAGWGWRALVAFVAGGSMVGAGFGIAQLDSGTAEVVSAVDQPSAPIVPAAASEIDQGAEPIAYVAAVLGPSVVQIETNLGLGSGVVIDPTTVITNNHVVEGATSVLVRLSDGTTMSGEIVGTDARTDVAVISVAEGSNLPPAQLARDEELSVGQLTVAIGSPFELQQTVTSGIISALDRPIQMTETSINAMIQTDTAINPGNSGGALADREGRVIGINTLIQTDGSSNTNIGLGFATPIDTVMDVAERIIAGDDLSPGFMGVAGDDDVNGAPGVVIREITEGSGAEDAGIQLGDRVLRIDGAPVSSLEELAGLVQSNFPGDTVQLDLVRDGVEMTIEVELGGR